MRLNFKTFSVVAGMMICGPVASASDNLLFDRASWEFEGAESIKVWQIKPRLAVDLVCTILNAYQGKLYNGSISSIRKAGDEVIGDYLMITLETIDFTRQTITMIDNPEGDVSSSDRMMTIRALPRSDSLMIRLNEPNGGAHEYCWESRPSAPAWKP